MDQQPPLTLAYWLLSLLPLIIILILLIGFRWSAAQSASLGVFVAGAIAIVFFRAGFEVISVATSKGIWDAVFVLYVVWPALLLYEITEKAGAFDVIRIGVEKFTKSRLLLVLSFGWVFASFLQGIAGFGTPVAIVAPLLVGIGVNPVMAVVIPLIGHSWANAFGTLAVAWLALTRVVRIDDLAFTAFAASIYLAIVDLFTGFTIAWLYGRWAAIKKGLPAIVIITVIHGAGQIILSTQSPVISTFIPVTIALASLFAIERIPLYQKKDDFESRIFTTLQRNDFTKEKPKMSLTMAFMPYFILIFISLFGLLIPPFNELLGRFSVGFPMPKVATGFGVIRQSFDAYGSFAVFTHPGSFLFLASIAGYIIFKRYGYYERGVKKEIFKGILANALPASVAIIGFLVFSTIMDHAGMISVLALGIAAFSSPPVYAFFANFIGLLGAFMTSSNTASNILLGPLQEQTAAASFLNESRILGAQTVGGAIGNAVAPANVVLGTGTAGISGKEGEVLRYTLPWSLIAATLVGIASVVFLIINFVVTFN